VYYISLVLAYSTAAMKNHFKFQKPFQSHIRTNTRTHSNLALYQIFYSYSIRSE